MMAVDWAQERFVLVVSPNTLELVIGDGVEEYRAALSSSHRTDKISGLDEMSKGNCKWTMRVLTWAE